MTGKYLITTDNWFIAPDGKQYRSVWGEVEVIEDTFLGLKTNRNSTNWYVKVGSEVNHMIVAGCQIHYAIKCENKPNVGMAEDYDTSTADNKIDKGIRLFNRPTQIYCAE